MKTILALALVAIVSSTASAATPAPRFFGCRLDGTITHTDSQVELILIRGEQVSGRGHVSCVDALGHKYAQNVRFEIQSGGVGPAFNGPLDGLHIFALRAGVVTRDGMAGQYNLSAGPRFGFIEARVGVMAGVQVSGGGASLGVEAVIENRFSVGLDLGGMSMTIMPTTRLARVK